jgi:hypothetical protein
VDKYEWMKTTIDGKFVAVGVAFSAMWIQAILLGVALRVWGFI